MRIQVAIIGAGPAGLVLSHLLRSAGISSVVLEARSREHVERRIRAGVLEQGTVDLIAGLGLDGRLRREGLEHSGVEWRIDGRRYHIPVSNLTGGRGVTVYGQQELVKDLIRERIDAGEPLVFNARDVTLHDLTAGRARVTYTDDSGFQQLECDFVAGCDGFHGVCRPSIPERSITLSDHDFPFAWLGILAEAPPSTDEVIYCHSSRGFALHSMRSPTVSRLYLQCHPQDSVRNWSDDRIWQELRLRFATHDGWALNDGPIVEKSITPMRSVVSEPMQYGRLFLAGDAAHIVPPTGAKGLNQAVADVAVLAEALTDRYRTGRCAKLDDYSITCLRRVWRVQHFASWMTWAFHRWEGSGDFVHRMQAMQLEEVCKSRSAARSVAENYAGLPIEANLPALAGWPMTRVAERARGRRLVALQQPPARDPTIVGSPAAGGEHEDLGLTSG